MMKAATDTPRRFDRRPGSAGQINGQGLQYHHERAVCESLRQPVRCRVRQLLGFQDAEDERTASGRHHLVPPRRGARLQPQAGEHALDALQGIQPAYLSHCPVSSNLARVSLKLAPSARLSH
jgi:hypothetical protein